MLRSLFGTGTVTSMLRGGLEETSATHKTIAARVAGALEASSSNDFAKTLASKSGQQAAADLERDMASLADNEVRYEADAKLLQGAYAQLRAALKSSG